jgi:hypothetical protein
VCSKETHLTGEVEHGVGVDIDLLVPRNHRHWSHNLQPTQASPIKQENHMVNVIGTAKPIANRHYMYIYTQSGRARVPLNRKSVAVVFNVVGWLSFLIVGSREVGRTSWWKI